MFFVKKLKHLLATIILMALLMQTTLQKCIDPNIDEIVWLVGCSLLIGTGVVILCGVYSIDKNNKAIKKLSNDLKTTLLNLDSILKNKNTGEDFRTVIKQSKTNHAVEELHSFSTQQS